MSSAGITALNLIRILTAPASFLSVGINTNKMSKNKKYLQYAAMITGAIGSMFEEDNEWAVDQEELMEGDSLTHFMHALANVAPAH